MYCKFLFMCFL